MVKSSDQSFIFSHSYPIRVVLRVDFGKTTFSRLLCNTIRVTTEIWHWEGLNIFVVFLARGQSQLLLLHSVNHEPPTAPQCLPWAFYCSTVSAMSFFLAHSGQTMSSPSVMNPLPTMLVCTRITRSSIQNILDCLYTVYNRLGLFSECKIMCGSCKM